MIVKIVNHPQEGGIEKVEAINVIPFGFVKEVDYRRQIDGSAQDLVKLGRISKSLGGASLFGGISQNCGMRKMSVFVFEKGRLCAICDINQPTEEYATSFGYDVFNFNNKKYGVLVGEDLFFPDAVKSLVMCNCSLIINLYAGILTNMAKKAAEFYAYVYGVNFIVAAQNESIAFDSLAVPINTTADGLFYIDAKNKYRDVKVKRRGKSL